MASSDDETDTLIATYTKQNAGNAASQDNSTFYVVSLLTSLIPAYLFFGVFGLDLSTFVAVYALAIVGGAVGLTYSYQNTAQNLRNKLLASREEAITLRSVAAEASTRGEKPHNLVRKKKEQLAKLTAKEANAYAIFYSNSVFLATFLVLARVVFIATLAPVNYVLSVTLSAALVSLFATSKQ